MKVNLYKVHFEKSFTIIVAAPADALAGEVEGVAQSCADDGLDGWHIPEGWHVAVGSVTGHTVPDEQRQTVQVEHATKCKPSVITRADMVLSDDRDDLVASTDAKWWQVPVYRFRGAEAVGTAQMVKIQHYRSHKEVVGLVFDDVPGLAVNQDAEGKEWQVSHTPSGYAVCRCVNQSEALRAVARFGESDIDWTADAETLMANPKVRQVVQGDVPQWAL